MSNPNGHFAFIPKSTTHSQELNTLSVYSRWIYVLMVAEQWGANLDGGFTFPYGEIMEITGFCRNTIAKAVKELSQAGFLYYEHGGLEANPNIYKLEDSWLHR